MSKNTAQNPTGTASQTDRLRTQVWRYVVFGAFSTAVDFAVMNLFEYALHMSGIIANIISLTASLAVGYLISERLVFRGDHDHSRRRQIVYYTIITLVGTYGLQSGLFALLSQYPLAQNAIAGFIAPIVGHIQHVQFNILESNSMKLLATIATGFWNFVLVRKFVFANAKAEASA